MENSELKKVEGGISASSINALARVVNSLLTIGQMIGSAIKRKLRGEVNYC